ncbi:MAG TPA: AgmX/PglI C-terminal domain-containing protein [Polyangia bacterium]|nr:AgmX/PglI C-terminal domain-containing protein [Polyangia bacterium]
MKGFLLGLVVAALAFGGYVYWKEGQRPSTPAKVAADAGAPVKEARERKKRRHRGATRLARAENGGATSAGPRASAPVAESEPEPVKLSSADLKLVSQGDNLSRPDVIHLGDATDESGSRELTQEDIDARFRAKEDNILDCIAHARPDEETYVPGRVTVKFRIQRTGNVRGVQVEAPAILQRGGLTGCVKGVVGGLRFPPSNGSQVVSYPFSLT